MNVKLEREVLRLVDEIAKEERDLRNAQTWANADNAKRCLATIERKMKLIETLQKFGS